MGFFKDFKAFLFKGDIINLATAVIVATAFGAIVKSFTDDILMPPIGLALGGVDFSELKVILKEAQPEQIIDGVTQAAVPAVSINYGNFLQMIINFVIIGFCIFVLLRVYAKMKEREKASPEPASPPAPSTQEQLLMEIRDALKAKQ